MAGVTSTPQLPVVSSPGWVAGNVTGSASSPASSSPLPNVTVPNEGKDGGTMGAVNILLGTILYALVLLTVLGNAMVLIAVARTKRLQTVFNMYIVNLALTDILVGLTAMSFYSTENLLGYWPFGEFMCGVWIFMDYGMTFSSVFTLLAISVDRLWAVRWSLHYRSHKNKTKTFMGIALTWVCMLVLWLPPCILDRIDNSVPGECIWEPSKNQEFVVVVAVIGHHGSCFSILFCYASVLLLLRQRVKVAIGSTGRHVAVTGTDAAPTAAAAAATAVKGKVEERSATDDSDLGTEVPVVTFGKADSDSRGSTEVNSVATTKMDVSENHHVEMKTAWVHGAEETTDVFSTGTPEKQPPRTTGQTSDGNEKGCIEIIGAPRDGAGSSTTSGKTLESGGRKAGVHFGSGKESAKTSHNEGQQGQTGRGDKKQGQAGGSKPAGKSARGSTKKQGGEAREAKKEMKAFVTLSYIVVSYMLCWVPFHVVFDISAVQPDLIPDLVFTVTFWMTYLNSAVNPILYNFSSQDFRKAFKEILHR